MSVNENGNHPPLDVRPVAGRIGAEIIGGWLSGELDSSTVKAIRQALFKYQVIFFRGQSHLPGREARASARRIEGEPSDRA